MEKDRILATLAEEFGAALELTRTATPRSFQFPSVQNLIKVAIGMRRSGKTYFLFQTIRELQAEGVPLERILYLNFEDDRLLPLEYKEMGQLVDAWYALQPARHEQCCYLFFDEVQNVEGWQLVLRRLADTKRVQIYATGSSAKLLSKEIATSLRGRSLAVEIFPYSYLEYLDAHHLPLPSREIGQRELDHQRSYLLDFFRIGGFPGIQALASTERTETLQSYVETVVFRDVAERHHVSNVGLLKILIGLLLKGVGAPFSINKFFNDMKSRGHRAAKDTVYTYLNYLEDAFLVFAVPIFTESPRRAQTAVKKIYAIDNGLLAANTFNFSENLGKCLENQVYLDLRRQGKKVFYYHTESGFEVDFVTQDLQGHLELIQVVWDADDPLTREREERALRQAEHELGVKGRLIDWRSYLERVSP